MPWSIQKRDGKYCVVKEGGETIKCHALRTDAIKHQRTLYANEPSARRASMGNEVSGSTQHLYFSVPIEALAVSGTTGGTSSTTPIVPLTAAVAPLKPSRSLFERPEPDRVMPMTYEDDGSVYGHLAPWETCHAGLSAGAFSECVLAPRSHTDYQQFHLGEIETAEGDRIAVGKIVLATGHASTTADLTAATSHYDNTGSVGAFVRASNGRHGIWASGVVRSDLSPELLRDLRANAVSGDWRSFNGVLELVAALAVPVPGFPIPRAQLALAASGEIQTLILTPGEEPIVASYSATQRRKRKRLTGEIDEMCS